MNDLRRPVFISHSRSKMLGACLRYSVFQVDMMNGMTVLGI